MLRRKSSSEFARERQRRIREPSAGARLPGGGAGSARSRRRNSSHEDVCSAPGRSLPQHVSYIPRRGSSRPARHAAGLRLKKVMNCSQSKNKEMAKPQLDPGPSSSKVNTEPLSAQFQLVSETKLQRQMAGRKHPGTFTSYDYKVILKRQRIPSVCTG